MIAGLECVLELTLKIRVLLSAFEDIWTRECIQGM